MLAFDPVDAEFGFPAAILETSGQRILVTERYAAAVKMPKDDMLNAPWQAMVHPDDLGAVAQPYDRLIASGEPYEFRCRMRDGEGLWIPVHYRATRGIDRNSGRMVIYAHVRGVEQVKPAVTVEARVAPRRESVLDYIREMTQELSRMAGAERRVLLQHLLAMASAEAESELEKDLRAIGRLGSEHHTKLH